MIKNASYFIFCFLVAFFPALVLCASVSIAQEIDWAEEPTVNLQWDTLPESFTGACPPRSDDYQCPNPYETTEGVQIHNASVYLRPVTAHTRQIQPESIEIRGAVGAYWRIPPKNADLERKK